MPASNSPILSIVIPTRNRDKYAISAINSILSIPAPDLELVVQDNGDSRDLEDHICNSISDPRLRYNHSPRPLSFVDNFDIAVGLASGKYVCIIGDDDGVNPEIVEATRWADMNDIDAVNPVTSVYYLWPNAGAPSTFFTKVLSDGILSIKSTSGKIRAINPEIELRKLVRRGGCKYLETYVPRLYHGIVLRECLNKVRKEAGVFFGGLSPDIFAAVAVACVARKAVSIDYPLTIAGTSKLSGAGMSRRGEHVGGLDDTPHLKYRGDYKWSEIVPRFYSVETVWADTAIAALKILGRDDLLQNFSIPFLAASCITTHPEYKSIILRDMYKAFRLTNKNFLLGTLEFGLSVLTGPVWSLLKRILNRVRIIFLGNKSSRFTNVEDMIAATRLLTRYLEENGRRFADVPGSTGENWKTIK